MLLNFLNCDLNFDYFVDFFGLIWYNFYTKAYWEVFVDV